MPIDLSGGILTDEVGDVPPVASSTVILLGQPEITNEEEE